jgi:hypothetical protein
MQGRILVVVSLLLGSGLAFTFAQPHEASDHASDHGTVSTVTGRITGYTTAAHGEMDGFTLDSGATVHFPIYVGARLLPLIQKGQRVEVTGTLRGRRTAQILDATLVRNRALRESVDVASIPPPAPPWPTIPPTPPWGAVAPPGRTPLGQPPSAPPKP